MYSLHSQSLPVMLCTYYSNFQRLASTTLFSKQVLLSAQLPASCGMGTER